LQFKQFWGHNPLKYIYYGLITCNEIEEFFTILKHVIVSRVMTLRSKKFGKYVVCDELYNSLLQVIKLFKKKFHHISKRIFFMLSIPSRGVQKVESRACQH
jgi:hypothetical protein